MKNIEANIYLSAEQKMYEMNVLMTESLFKEKVENSIVSKEIRKVKSNNFSEKFKNITLSIYNILNSLVLIIKILIEFKIINI